MALRPPPPWAPHTCCSSSSAPFPSPHVSNKLGLLRDACPGCHLCNCTRFPPAPAPSRLPSCAAVPSEAMQETPHWRAWVPVSFAAASGLLRSCVLRSRIWASEVLCPLQPCCWLTVGACTLPTLPRGGARNGGSGSVAPVLGPTPALDCWGRGRHVCPGWLSLPLHWKGTGHEPSGASLVWKVPSRPLCRLHLVVAGTEMPETSMGGPESRPVEGPGHIGRVWGEWRPADGPFDTEWFVSRPVDRLRGGVAGSWCGPRGSCTLSTPVHSLHLGSGRIGSRHLVWRHLAPAPWLDHSWCPWHMVKLRHRGHSDPGCQG